MSKATRLIDADALSKMLDKHGGIYGGKEAEMSEYFNSLLKYAPTVDAEPVIHAHWVDRKAISGKQLPFCSKCRRTGIYRTMYCSCCGAKMDEVVEHEQTN